MIETTIGEVSGVLGVVIGGRLFFVNDLTNEGQSGNDEDRDEEFFDDEEYEDDKGDEKVDDPQITAAPVIVNAIQAIINEVS